MNKYMIAAAALAATAMAAPATAQSVGGSVTIRVGQQDYYGQLYNDYNHRYRGYYGQRYRYQDNYLDLYRRYFQYAPSAFGNSCGLRYDVIVRDPYTGRLVCMDRYTFQRYQDEVRFGRFRR